MENPEPEGFGIHINSATQEFSQKNLKTLNHTCSYVGSKNNFKA